MAKASKPVVATAGKRSVTGKRRTAVKAAQVLIVRLAHCKGLPLPSYQSDAAAGFDLVAAIADGQPLTLVPGGRALVPTGLVLELPDGFEGQVRPRSGLAFRHGVTVLNSPGTIDADYRGEVQVILVNLGDRAVTIARGERIAQLVVAPVIRVALTEVKTLTETVRGAGGFGSTGRGETSQGRPKKQTPASPGATAKRKSGRAR